MIESWCICRCVVVGAGDEGGSRLRQADSTELSMYPKTDHIPFSCGVAMRCYQMLEWTWTAGG